MGMVTGARVKGATGKGASGAVDDASSPDPHQELQELRAEFEDSTTPLQHLAARVRRILGAPMTVIIVTAGAVIWAIANALDGRQAPDPPPFSSLNTFATVAALVATILILSGQRREDEAAKRVSRMTLHLAAESEMKIAKLIQLVEEQRRDNASLPNRPDEEAEEMRSPAGPREILKRLEDDME